MDAPAIEIVVTQADGSQIFSEQKDNLQRALQELSSFSSDQTTESSEDSSEQDLAPNPKQWLGNPKLLHDWIDKNHQVREQQKEKTARFILDLLTLIKQKNQEQEAKINDLQTQLFNVTSGILKMNQQQIKQQKAHINDLKYEQKAIKDEFPEQYKKIYSNQIAAVSRINQQHEKTKKEFKQENAQLWSYVKLFGFTTGTVTCVLVAFLTWFYTHHK